MCCLLLDSTEDAVELFCEQHEDVLLKHADGTFSGLQLKTRDDDQRLWSTTDEDLLSSFAKFAKLETLFPGQLRLSVPYQSPVAVHQLRQRHLPRLESHSGRRIARRPPSSRSDILV
jgi:hypothetical protein